MSPLSPLSPRDNRDVRDGSDTGAEGEGAALVVRSEAEADSEPGDRPRLQRAHGPSKKTFKFRRSRHTKPEVSNIYEPYCPIRLVIDILREYFERMNSWTLPNDKP